MTTLEAGQITRTSTITIKTSALRELLEGVATHAGTDKSLPVLNSVLLLSPVLANGEGKLIAVATDRYRLIEGESALEGEGNLPATLIQLDDVKKIIAMMKGDKSPSTSVTIQRNQDTITVSHLSQALVFQALDGTFPPYVQLFPTDSPVPLESVIYNPSLFADYGKIVGKKGAVTITFYGKKKPMGIDLAGDHVTWRALLMPMSK